MAADRLSLVIPMYRSAATLTALLQRLSATVPGSEVVFVDDACPERSADHVAAISCHDLEIVIVRVVPNVGQQAAVQIGALHATGNIIVVMDADLQDAPEDVPVMVSNLGATLRPLHVTNSATDCQWLSSSCYCFDSRKNSSGCWDVPCSSRRLAHAHLDARRSNGTFGSRFGRLWCEDQSDHVETSSSP